ncbi:hypothetical protein VSR01_32290 [Actinacidiphila sp. DG2A-62]|uniref:hypothetical protein n=1 Tax=Actinacidiphila sp. DG2A-62 TaxID=3108821 RepID=UPI002DBE8B6B|nr:hypothetical protein [Actinacidiphila sp. DG2A-62]MEC3997917.1 hypothetical protein [Actinacidiphila sp. DG2A-62]
MTVAAEDTPDAVFAALRENNDRPYGRARTVRAEELVAAAEQFDDKGALVTALFELMSAYTYGGEQRKSPVAFARIMKMWDERPEDFSEWEEHQLYWRFKWVTTALLQLPEMPLAAIERWTGEMRERYAAAGHGMQPVYAMRYLVARHTGTATDEAYDLWTTRPRTDLSDCEACETRLRARHHEASGDDERALREWRPVLEGGQSCLEEPYVSMAYALLPLVRTGRTDEARSHHLAGYRFARGKPDMAEAIGLHLEFCALTRNEGRGLEILAENRAMFEATGTPLDLLGFLTGVEVLLARLAGQGHGTLAVSGPPGRSWTVDALLAHVHAEGARLAAAFDARNGSDAVGARRLARLARMPLLVAPLALGVRAAGPALPAPAPAPGPVGAAAEPAPEDFGDLVRRARELSAIGRPDADGLWDLVERRAAEPGHVHDEALGPAELLAAELAERRAFAGFDRDDWGPARDTMLEAAARYDAAGNPGRAASARARAATALVAAAQQTDGAAHRADAGPASRTPVAPPRPEPSWPPNCCSPSGCRRPGPSSPTGIWRSCSAPRWSPATTWWTCCPSRRGRRSTPSRPRWRGCWPRRSAWARRRAPPRPASTRPRSRPAPASSRRRPPNSTAPCNWWRTRASRGAPRARWRCSRRSRCRADTPRRRCRWSTRRWRLPRAGRTRRCPSARSTRCSATRAPTPAISPAPYGTCRRPRTGWTARTRPRTPRRSGWSWRTCWPRTGGRRTRWRSWSPWCSAAPRSWTRGWPRRSGSTSPAGSRPWANSAPPPRSSCGSRTRWRSGPTSSTRTPSSPARPPRRWPRRACGTRPAPRTTGRWPATRRPRARRRCSA